MTPDENPDFLPNIFGPVAAKPKLREYVGTEDFRCPACATMLLTDTNRLGADSFDSITCFGCGKPWSGKELVSSIQ